MLFFFSVLTLNVGDQTALVKKAVEKSTLNQAGTKPFHLIADVAPSFERDRASNRTGHIEIWWKTPTEWRRELRAANFHQVAIRNGVNEWQRNEGDYFPEWLREIYVAVIEPVPNLDEVLKQVRGSEARAFAGAMNLSWTISSTDGTVEKTMGAGLTIRNDLLEFGSGLGWSFSYKDFHDFHGRSVAYTVSSGSIEVTAKVQALEDLKETPAGGFDIPPEASDPLLQTVIVEEIALRKNLSNSLAPSWPPIKDGPLAGILTTEILVDRTGKVREIGTIVSDNPALDGAATEFVAGLRFQPYIVNGNPVQVVSRITMPFKTVRPEGMENFDNARNYFERGRKAGFPAAGGGPPYALHATFQIRDKSGATVEGQYADVWKSGDEWRREASINDSRCIRTQHGDKRFRQDRGAQAGLLNFVIKVLEPIPTLDTFVESDWRIKRDTVDGTSTIRVLTGYESADGTLDPEQVRGYWFDEQGRLLKTFFKGLETRRGNFEEFDGVQFARQIKVLQRGSVAMVIRVTSLSALNVTPDEKEFELHGHEWKRQFTDEVR